MSLYHISDEHSESQKGKKKLPNVTQQINIRLQLLLTTNLINNSEITADPKCMTF